MKVFGWFQDQNRKDRRFRWPGADLTSQSDMTDWKFEKVKSTRELKPEYWEILD
jgi:hypothetical protein